MYLLVFLVLTILEPVFIMIYAPSHSVATSVPSERIDESSVPSDQSVAPSRAPKGEVAASVVAEPTKVYWKMEQELLEQRVPRVRRIMTLRPYIRSDLQEVQRLYNCLRTFDEEYAVLGRNPSAYPRLWKDRWYRQCLQSLDRRFPREDEVHDLQSLTDRFARDYTTILEHLISRVADTDDETAQAARAVGDLVQEMSDTTHAELEDHWRDLTKILSQVEAGYSFWNAKNVADQAQDIIKGLRNTGEKDNRLLQFSRDHLTQLLK